MADQFLLEEMLLLETHPMNQSAFVRYPGPAEGFGLGNSIVVSNHQNMNKRMIKFLTENRSMNCDYREFERDRSYRHMISERLRREKEKQGYAALHSLLPPRTKIDKNSIVHTATSHLQTLIGLKEELRKRNCELEENLQVNERDNAEVAKIKLRVKSPSSSIDSMIGVLCCLKSMGLKAKTIQSEFSIEEFSAVIEIETKTEAWIIEGAVQNALVEVEKKHASDFSHLEWSC